MQDTIQLFKSSYCYSDKKLIIYPSIIKNIKVTYFLFLFIQADKLTKW